jgi:hypothetical protein
MDWTAARLTARGGGERAGARALGDGRGCTSPTWMPTPRGLSSTSEPSLSPQSTSSPPGVKRRTSPVTTGPRMARSCGHCGAGEVEVVFIRAIGCRHCRHPARLRSFASGLPAGIRLVRHEVDAQLILDAADRARAIFPDGQRVVREGREWRLSSNSQVRARLGRCRSQALRHGATVVSRKHGTVSWGGRPCRPG